MKRKSSLSGFFTLKFMGGLKLSEIGVLELYFRLNFHVGTLVLFQHDHLLV